MHFFTNTNPDLQNLISAFLHCVRATFKKARPGDNSLLVYVITFSLSTTKPLKCVKFPNVLLPNVAKDTKPMWESKGF